MGSLEADELLPPGCFLFGYASLEHNWAVLKLGEMLSVPCPAIPWSYEAN